MIYTVEFWKGLGDRAVKTFAQTFVAAVMLQVGAEAVGVSAGLGSVGWTAALSIAALNTLLSAATSIGDPTRTSGLDAREKGRHEAV